MKFGIWCAAVGAGIGCLLANSYSIQTSIGIGLLIYAVLYMIGYINSEM